VQVMITVSEEPDGTSIRVDGWLAGDGVQELVHVLRSVSAPVRLLLRDLRGADEAGFGVLRRLARQATHLEGLSPYMELMLASPEHDGLPASASADCLETRVRREVT